MKRKGKQRVEVYRKKIMFDLPNPRAITMLELHTEFKKKQNAKITKNERTKSKEIVTQRR